MVLRDLEYRGNPQKPQSTCAKQRHDHRCDRIAHAPQRAYQHIHDSAKCIRSADHLHTNHSLCDDRLVIRIDAQQLVSEQDCPVSKHKSHNCHTTDTLK